MNAIRLAALVAMCCSLSLIVGCKKNTETTVIDTYRIQDSVYIPWSLEWVKREYPIEIINGSNTPNYIIMDNLCRRQMLVIGTKSDNILTIPDQRLDPAWGDETTPTFDAIGSGMFTSDSIKFECTITNGFGEVFDSKGSGIKLYSTFHN